MHLNRLTSTLLQLVQGRLLWFGHTSRRPYDELIRDLLLRTYREFRLAEDVSDHAQRKPGTSLRTAILRLLTMEKGLGENLKRARTGPLCLDLECCQFRVNATTSTRHGSSGCCKGK